MSLNNFLPDEWPFIRNKLKLDLVDLRDQYDKITDLAKELTNKKEELIKQKLINKGYAWLIPQLKPARFPKIAIVKKDGWDYYFVDDNTVQGDFIVAIKEADVFTQKNDPRSYGVKFETHFKYQDTDFSPVKIEE